MNALKWLKQWIVKENIIRWFNFLAHHLLFDINAFLYFDLVNLFFIDEQQNTAYELNALSAQWKELSLKNIEIQAACAKIENYIDEFRKEAVER